jgi:hypothetical protein
MAATASTASFDREDATTSAPASARPIDMAFPMPEVPPTTTAHFPARLNISTDGLPNLFWVLLMPLGLLLQLNRTVTEIDHFGASCDFRLSIYAICFLLIEDNRIFFGR